MSENLKNYLGYMWMREEDGVITIGINEEGLEDLTEIQSIDLPAENEKVEAEVACGTIETDDGPLDIYPPVSGTIVEINSQVIDDPTIIMEDPFEEGWLLRIEPVEESDDDDEDDDDDDDEDEEELEEDEE
ncbi:MAG: glycine cleavage system protein H [Pseudobdellovibrionaceae bacterium]